MPITGILFAIYVALEVATFTYRRDDAIEYIVALKRLSEVVLLFTILYVCNC